MRKPLTADTMLPPLRQELRVLPAADDGDSGGYLLFDPLRHSYFRISARFGELLARWREVSAGDLLESCAGPGNPRPTLDDLDRVVRFLSVNRLLAQAEPAAALAQRRQQARRRWLSWLVHSYLFFRIPLVRPERFLNATLPWVRWLGARPLRITFFLIALTGLYLAGRQWDAFSETFVGLLNWRGLATYLVTLLAVKVIHELAHAYVATHHGVRVSTMGVAFMVMLPMLYTDATDAWKLRSSRARMLIDAAGILAELALAGVALLLWSILEPGPARSVAFAVATTGWVMSLAVNLSPFMRFDGYHLFADWLGIHNLAPRAFALGRWRLREALFGLGLSPPESFPANRRRLLIAYAWATWVYRFFLFIGIALVVYHAFFKLLGVVLFAVEIFWFIARPLWREISVWWRMRKRIISRPAAWRTLAIVALLMVVFLLPWRTSATVPAILSARDDVRVFAGLPARLVSSHVRQGQRVEAGQLLARLTRPKLETAIATTGLRLKLANLRLSRIAGDRDERTLYPVLKRERTALTNALAAYRRQAAQLDVIAPVAGTVRFLARDLRPGRWVSATEVVAVIVPRAPLAVTGLVDESDSARIVVGALGRFIPDDPMGAARDVRLVSLGSAPANSRSLAYLASVSGGPVMARRTSNGRLHTTRAVFLARFDVVDEHEGPTFVTRGVVKLKARAQSLAGRLARRFIAVVLREAGL